MKADTSRPSHFCFHRCISALMIVFVQTWRADASIAQEAYLKTSHTGAGDYFGYSVAVSGDTMVVGAYLEDSNATGVDGDPSNDGATDSGAAYVFVRNGTTWSQQAYLKASNTGASAYFGYSVAVSGDTVLIGAPGDFGRAGAVYVFVREGTTWSEQAYLRASQFEAVDVFGYSVAVSGDTMVVGAPYEDSDTTGVNGDPWNNNAVDSGAAYVFVREGTTWSQHAYLKASNTGVSDGFGYSVAVSGDTVVVGAWWESSNATGINGNQADNSAASAGAAYVFVREETTWSQQAYLKASNSGGPSPGEGFGDYFGVSVAVSGDTVVVGAPREDSDATGVNGNQSDNSALNSGAAYVFVRSGTAWSQQAYLKASNTGVGDLFGRWVTVSADTVAVGAWQEDSNATGIDGDESDNLATDSGAAYAFVRNGTIWRQQAYLKASNTGSSDYFGFPVSVSGDTVAVGAWQEDSNAIGVNGDGRDNSALDSGAAYVFTGLGIGPRLALAPDGSGGYFLRFTGHAGFTYRLQRATTLPGSWDTIDTLTAPASGLVEFRDTAPPPGPAFYRIAAP